MQQNALMDYPQRKTAFKHFHARVVRNGAGHASKGVMF
jgi:hypothetical protein